MSKVLVTGATGFIGPHLIAHLLTRGHRVRALASPTGDVTRLPLGDVEVVRGDLRDAGAMKRAVASCGIVFHLAVQRSGAPAKLLEAVNVTGTEILSRAALKADVARVVLCGATRAYGLVRDRAITEETDLHPDTPYARSRVLAERIVGTLGGPTGRRGVVARLGPVLGPGARNWLPVFRRLATDTFRLSGRGDNYQHLADVADIVDGLVRCGLTPDVEGRVYLLAGAQPIRLRHLLELIAGEVGGTRFRPGLPTAVLRLYLRANATASRLTGTQLPGAERPFLFLTDRIFDLTRARRELGYAPVVGMRETVRRTADWFRAEGLL